MNSQYLEQTYPNNLAPTHLDNRGSISQTSSQSSMDNMADPNTMPTNPPMPASSEARPLDALTPEPEWVDCPKCNTRSQTMVQGRSKGKQRFMNVFWWPLPNRKHWWEETKWFCANCKEQLASQKNGKNLQVLV